MIERIPYSSGLNLRRLGNQSYIAVDPGVYGGAVLVHPQTAPCRPQFIWKLRTADLRDIGSVARDAQARVLVIETQYLAKNPSSSLKLAYSAGAIEGAIYTALGTGDLAVVRVAPASWQSRVHPGYRTRGALEIATRHVGNRALTQEERDDLTNRQDAAGVHTALCLAQWWEAVSA